jgi:hypothetical protein
MKNIVTLFLLLVMMPSFAQKRETFDLATYTVPSGWKEERRTKDVVSYVITNNQKGTYCQAGIFASTISKGNLKGDFESEWQTLVVKTYKPSTNPELVAPRSEGGWEVQAGVAPFDFNGGQSLVMMITLSGYQRCMSIVVLTNTEAYKADIDSFIGSIDLKKPEVVSQSVTNNNTPATTSNNNGDAGSIIGTWRMNSSDQSSFRVNNGVMNYILRQYIFESNGTYTFTSKAFDPLMTNIIFGKENGTYKTLANEVTVTPQKSVLQSWSKKDGSDKYGKLITSENRTLEKTKYKFTRHYFEGIQEYSLVLQVDAPTLRDGPVSSNTTFSNAYYYAPMSVTHPLIDQPGEQSGIEDSNTKPATTPALKTSFAFNTTNFDNGWTSTVQEDWVQVSKGNVKVLIHYPNKQADEYNTDVIEGLKKAWNVLVAPRYKSGSNFEFKRISGWQVSEFGEADLVDNAGSAVHVVLFKKNYSNGSGKYMEIITPDKRTFEQEFGAFDANASSWDKLENMVGYNKFGVAASDLKGKWSSKFTGTQQYVNANTGADAGMSSHASNENFEFGAGATYKWDLGVASGMVGNIKFQSVKSAGKFTVPSNWQVTFSDIEGKPRTYDAYFSCVKGARILWLGETAYGKIE